MIAELRKPFFFIAIVAIALVVLVELGSSLLLGGGGAGSAFLAQADKLDIEPPDASGVTEPQGRGIPYLVLVDVILLYTVSLMGVDLLVPDRVHGRVQGIVTVIGSIVLLIVAGVMLITAFAEVSVMVALFAAAPFGTIAYLALWGFFPTGDAAVVLGLLLFLKLAFCVFLLLAHQRFLQNKGLVLLIATSLLGNLIVAFLHGLVPIILVSIVDDIAAIVVAVLAIIWGIVLLIGSIPSVFKAIKA
ncbi:MAG: hypothetical protein ACRDSE_21955 [Pseudonocardiaceae bacterium]